MLRLFNTLTRRKERFEPINPGEVRMYTCGPTVYAAPHIGNYRSFLFADLLRRYLEYIGFKVIHVMNITDIDDKTIRDSAREGLDLRAFTEKYEKIFFEDVDLLNIIRASAYPRATENVEAMIEITKALMDKGYAYLKDGSVYFDVSKFRDYGKLSKVELKGLKAGARVDTDEYSKDSPADFALMKKSKPEEVARGIAYPSIWGSVRPGWHIECSAIGIKHLGRSFDIHTGGIDLVFPHHENEIAQSEAYTGVKFVNYWLHCEHLLVDGQKMAKSLGNIITLQTLIEKGYSPRAIRLLLISTHYRRQLNFTYSALDAAEHATERLLEFVRRLKEARGGATNIDLEGLVEATRSRFVEAMDDDLDIRRALSAVFGLVSKTNRLLDRGAIGDEDAGKLLRLILELDSVLGLSLEEALQEEVLPDWATVLIKRREEARARGDWATADEIRSRLRGMGILLEDTTTGVRWRLLKKR
jgi:cysteinyl-tRNA synthetase